MHVYAKQNKYNMSLHTIFICTYIHDTYKPKTSEIQQTKETNKQQNKTCTSLAPSPQTTPAFCHVFFQPNLPSDDDIFQFPIHFTGLNRRVVVIEEKPKDPSHPKKHTLHPSHFTACLIGILDPYNG